MPKIFVDTNILAYTADRGDRPRQKKCRELLLRLEGEGQGVISTQVMQEFFVVTTKKMGVDPLKAKGMLKLLEGFETVVITPQLIDEAVDCHILNQVSFWDALVIVSAASAKCEKIWTEDLNPGQVFQGVLIQNPLISP